MFRTRKGSIAGPFERGLLAGGLGTVLFYITLGRNGIVSDVSFMSRTSSLSKNQISLIFGGIGLLQAVRIHVKDRYAHFFSVPDDDRTFSHRNVHRAELRTWCCRMCAS